MHQGKEIIISVKKIAEKFFNASWLASWKPFFLLFVAVLLLYGQSIFFNLTYLDDNVLVAERRQEVGNFQTVKEIFLSDAFFSNDRSYYRPILNLSFFSDARLSASGYHIYHVANLFWHYLAVILIFIILRRLSCRPLFSFVAALLFSVHPVLVQAVAWLPGRNDSLVAVFILAGFWSFLNYCRRPSLKWLIFYFIFFSLSLLSKETAVFLPLVCLFYFLVFGVFGKKDKMSISNILLPLVLSVVLIFSWFALRRLVLGGGVLSSVNAAAGIFSGLLPAIPMGAKMLLPLNLSVLPVAADTGFFLSLLAWPLFIFICFYFKKKDSRLFIFGLFWLAVFFLPSFAASASAPFLLEHRLYLPLIGLLIVFGSFENIKNFSWQNRKYRFIFLVILITFFAISFFHSWKFSDSESFWQAAVLSSPSSPLAHKNRGVIYYFSGNYSLAEREYNMALKLNSSEVMANNNLGLIYMNRGDYWRAEAAFWRELEINPGFDKALVNLAELYVRTGKIKEARIYALEALRVSPGFGPAEEILTLIDKSLNKNEDSLK